MKAVILDGYTTNPGDLSWDWLNKFGEYTAHEFTTHDEIVERSRDCEIVITNKTPLGKDVLSQMPKLKYIGLLSTGYNVVDCDFAASLGVPVVNIPTYSTAAVAQLTFALLFELTNKVGMHNDAVKNGEWTNGRHFCFWKAPLVELLDKTFGIVGYGKIGKTVSNAAKAFGMKVSVYTPHPPAENGDVNYVSLDELLKSSDVVSMHCPLTPDTTQMVNADFLSKMKSTAYLINTSRGAVVDEQALAAALHSGKIAGAAVDVLSTEPPKADNPLLACNNCIITPHIAWAGFETRARLMKICEENLQAFIDGKPQNVVNL